MSMLMLGKDRPPRIGARLSQSQTRKLLIVGTKLNIFDTNASDSEGARKGEIVGVQKQTSFKPQDVEFVVPHQLLYKLEVETFAGVSCSTYWKMQFLNMQCLQLMLKSYDIFRMRRECGFVEPYVFMLPGGETCWTMFDKKFEKFEKLPKNPSDYCFYHTDKETICAGTHLIVVGQELGGHVVWRYELETRQWVKDRAMITPRCMYASASRGTEAFFAGGNKDRIWTVEVVNTAETYNSQTKTWRMIHAMHKRRKFSSGCFLRGKFYVIGGRDENDQHLTCGESYDEVTDSWKLIPNMLGGITFMPSQSPPLIAVANNNLYLLEAYSNELRVYDINANTWKKLGVAPVRTNVVFGWGVAFKSIGDRLLLIGTSNPHCSAARMRVFTCRRPSPNVEELVWEELNNNYGNVGFSHFIRNCCVMFA